MPVITLQCGGKVVKRFRVTQDARIRIGRSDENDVVIEDSAVSAVHAEIEPEGDHFYITDFNSRNGTFVNRELVISRRLAHGDTVSIGNHCLVFMYGKNEKMPPAPESKASGATMYIDTPNHRAQLARSVAEIAERGKVTRNRAILAFLTGSGDSVTIEKEVMTIGKAAECDIVARGWFVAPTSAEIVTREDGTYLNPVGGKPPRINSRPVKAETRLSEFDIIEVGSTALQLQFRRADKDK